VSFKGPSRTIKSHHNVGGLPERMALKLVEPLRELFKDEVRELGRLLDVPDEILSANRFPVPASRSASSATVTQERLALLRAVEHDRHRGDPQGRPLPQALAGHSRCSCR